jgi:hypothetical protein
MEYLLSVRALTLHVTWFHDEDKQTSKLERQIVCLKISYALTFSVCLFNVIYICERTTRHIVNYCTLLFKLEGRGVYIICLLMNNFLA